MTFDIHARLFDAAPDEDAILAWAEELVALFAASPEAWAAGVRGEARWVGPFVSFMLEYEQVTPPDLAPEAARAIPLELFPRHLSASPGDAPAMLTELRAFFAFLHRAWRLPTALACAAALDAAAEATLAQRLADPAWYGLDKLMGHLGGGEE